jgi:hypothetical protein
MVGHQLGTARVWAQAEQGVPSLIMALRALGAANNIAVVAANTLTG